MKVKAKQLDQLKNLVNCDWTPNQRKIISDWFRHDPNNPNSVEAIAGATFKAEALKMRRKIEKKLETEDKRKG